MNWLKRLFGGGWDEKRQTVPPPPSNPDAFWRIIEQAKAHTQEAQLEALNAALSPLTPDELIAFHADYDRQVDAAYRWDLWAAAYVINGGCSDDGFDYFRDWLISLGRDTYDLALPDPGSLISVLGTIPDGTDASFEEFRYVVGDVYKKKTGADLPLLDFGMCPDGPAETASDPAGERWEEEDVNDMFPQLAEWANERF